MNLLDHLDLILALALVVGTGVTGYEMGRRHCSEERRMAQDAYNTLESQFKTQALRLQDTLLEQKNEKRQIEAELHNVVQAPIYLGNCFDDAGLRLANRTLVPPYRPATGQGVRRIDPAR